MYARTALAILAATTAAPVPAASFCERLAPEIGLSPKTDRTGTFWQRNTLNPAQRLLVGGTSVMSLGVEPVGRIDDAERQRLDDMCRVENKSIVCNVAGPARVKAMLGETTARVEARSGERAKLWTTGTRVRCQDLSAG